MVETSDTPGETGDVVKVHGLRKRYRICPRCSGGYAGSEADPPA